MHLWLLASNNDSLSLSANSRNQGKFTYAAPAADATGTTKDYTGR